MQTDEDGQVMKGGSGKAEAEEEALADVGESWEAKAGAPVLRGRKGDPQHSARQPEEAIAYEQELAIDADPQLRAVGRAQNRGTGDAEGAAAADGREDDDRRGGGGGSAG